ncbi:hypothetical protein A5886_002473 [Enterococcus sp. 8G7_MSG3316]|uniref:Amidase domain-containing protein n=1 Tax=Candidatus Enterococcus testudinis TaxID=1834191 RepID=A0A242A9T4_9ENTE|nr:amidase [Enterococcus sp. 8G7_MSG3316]OTN77373.1 hypothetical protein A5886_002473 [Enterococcus sp. 8G7_MSG3316]
MQDATYWAEQLNNGNLSFTERLDMIETKIAQHNPKLNALIHVDRDASLKAYQAGRKQQRLFGGQPMPLKILGQSKAGWPATAGAKLFADMKANQTAHFVTALEQVGFVPFGQTNAPEFGFKNITDPELYGATRNPWNPLFSAGGSSGGAAAAVASGMFPIAGASDGGGSIRIPASFTGLIGLKPTRGAMPVGPGEWRSWQGASINFALTISMRDTQRLFYGLRTSQPAAPYQAPQVEWTHHKASQKKQLKVAFSTKSPVGQQVSETAIQAVRNAVDFLTEQGHQVEEVDYPIDGQRMMRSYYAMNGGETAAMFADIEAARGQSVGISEMELMTWGLYQYGRKLSAATYIQSLQYWDQIAERMERFFESFDLFLTPTTAFTAPLINADLQSDAIRRNLQHIDGLSEAQAADVIYEMFDQSYQLTPYTQLANLTGQPAISLPTTVSDEGLPLGIQFMASKGREDILFQVGQLFEDCAQFRLPPSVTE